ncbi:MAG: hypothetical protein HYT47_01885 [Candidatus Vogelbacteria bacterium]|nr:hypothetical protein [Candidatus Vogelbacteria bacterium]
MENSTVGSVSGTVLGMLADLCHKLQHGSLNREELARFLKRENPFDPSVVTVILTLTVWQKVYQALGCALDESLWVEPAPGFWDVYVQKGVTPERVVKAMRKLGIAVETLGVDLDAATNGRDERDPGKSGAYRVRFRANVEADEEFKNFSADDIKARGIQSNTLTERLLLGLAYFIVTEDKGDDLDARHLDRDNTTLCVGSRHSDGKVPGVRWHRDYRQVYVHWHSPQSRCAGWRARSAVNA